MIGQPPRSTPFPYTTLFRSANYLDSRKPKIIGIGREVVGLRADGSTFPMDLSVGEAKHQGGGSIFGIIIRDITSRKPAAEVLQNTPEQLRVASVTTLVEPLPAVV